MKMVHFIAAFVGLNTATTSNPLKTLKITITLGTLGTVGTTCVTNNVIMINNKLLSGNKSFKMMQVMMPHVFNYQVWVHL